MDSLSSEDLQFDTAAAAVGVGGIEVAQPLENGLVRGRGKVAIVDPVALDVHWRTNRDTELEKRVWDDGIVGEHADVGCDWVQVEDGCDELAALFLRAKIDPVRQDLRLY